MSRSVAAERDARGLERGVAAEANADRLGREHPAAVDEAEAVKKLKDEGDELVRMLNPKYSAFRNKKYAS